MNKYISLLKMTILMSIATTTIAANEMQIKKAINFSDSYLDCVINKQLPFDSECITITVNESDIFPNGILLQIREKHLPPCHGDPNIEPMLAEINIDTFGRLFKNDYAITDEIVPIEPYSTAKEITDIKKWQHPVKDVLNKYNIELQKVVLFFEKTFPIFYVKSLPFDNSDNSNKKEIFSQLLVANGNWDFIIITDDYSAYYVEGKKRKLIKSICNN